MLHVGAILGLGFWLQKIREFGRAIMRAEGQRAARNDPDIIVAAGDAAAADLD